MTSDQQTEVEFKCLQDALEHEQSDTLFEFELQLRQTAVLKAHRKFLCRVSLPGEAGYAAASWELFPCLC